MNIFTTDTPMFPRVDSIDRAVVLQFIKELGLDPSQVTRLRVDATSVYVERTIPLGPVEVPVTDSEASS